MEKYCKNCGRVFNDLKFKICPYCGSELSTRYGRQPIPRKLRHEVFKRDGYRCRECGASKDETSLEIDHIVPVARGGTNNIDNLQTLCRECNRMKHTDEWIGGKTDLETAKSKLHSLKNQIKNVKNELKQATNENDQIEYQYQLMKLEEILPILEKKYDKLYYENKQSEAKKEKETKRNQLYKKLYVKIDEEAFLKWSKDNFLQFHTKEDFIKYACTCSESDVNDYIHTCNLYKDLITNPQKLLVYNLLYDELDEESLEILRSLSSWNFRKGLLILEYMNVYGGNDPEDMKNKIKNDIKNEKERVKEEQNKVKEEKWKKKMLKSKIERFKPIQEAILSAYNRHTTLSVAAKVKGYNAKDVCIWYYRGKCGHPVYVEFYNEINKIKEPTSTVDKKYIPSTKKWYCNKCGRLNLTKECPYCDNKNLSKNHIKNHTINHERTYNKCRNCGKFIWSALSECPYCGSRDIDVN